MFEEFAFKKKDLGIIRCSRPSQSGATLLRDSSSFDEHGYQEINPQGVKLYLVKEWPFSEYFKGYRRKIVDIYVSHLFLAFNLSLLSPAMNKHSGQKQVVRKKVLSDYRLQIIPTEMVGLI